MEIEETEKKTSTKKTSKATGRKKNEKKPEAKIATTGADGVKTLEQLKQDYIETYRKDGVIYQTAELGKVDIGGGGTIAYILALYGMNVIDAGVAVLNMHAPWECISKADLYEAYEGYKSFIAGIGQ